MNSPVIEAVARATGRAVDSSVSLGASRQRPVRPEPRCRPGADPAPCLRARRHVLLRDLHLANHGHCGRPGGHRRAWARRGGARQPDLRCYRCYPRSAPPSYGLSNEPRNCKLNPETGSAAAVFGYPGTAQIDALEDTIAGSKIWSQRAVVGARLGLYGVTTYVVAPAPPR